jgi:hypothetical protein
MNFVKRTTERVGQKERIRQALLAAAQALVGEEKSCRSHGIRYCRNPKILLREAQSIEWCRRGRDLKTPAPVSGLGGWRNMLRSRAVSRSLHHTG